MIVPSDLVLILTALVVAGYIYSRQRSNRTGLPLPPGPKKWPIIGNLLQLPTSFEWETYAHWGEIYNSDILHIDAAGTSIIVVNSHKIAADLFDKRSSLYSSRIQSVMLNDLVGWNWLFGFMPYGEAWKERRRLFQHHFHPLDTTIHQQKELEYTHKMLQRLLETPEHFMDHLRHMIGAITINIGYGIDVQPFNDPYIEIAEQALIGLAAGANPGAFWVESFPFLKYVPSFLPGAGFKRKAAVWREWTRKMLEVPFAEAKRQIVEGSAMPSFTSMCLDNLDDKKDNSHQERVIKETAATFFVGGSDTTVSAMNTFMLAMVCYPEAQAKAQEEIDRVVGRSALPDFTDEESLPYLSALIKEVLRWRTVTPLAIPHYLTEDDEYNGYHLPAGSIVVGNAWAILHDKDDYPDPFNFRPERFLKDGKLNPEVRDPNAAFGFGRRVCPGKHIANSTLWIAAACILSTFNISKALDEAGNPIEPSQEYHSSMVLHALPFKCTIKPRSQRAEALIFAAGDPL
ncbi:cytochrome P450 [Crucibulum laeve]|uniref:Cytochrome P450 n=1 Tax=Crucibulum laeve TaxID=68775 RepID=A0A5C3LZ14_9AGAR|nr:cytochrome P450 [Crucibulum laeve]